MDKCIWRRNEDEISIIMKSVDSWLNDGDRFHVETYGKTKYDFGGHYGIWLLKKLALPLW